MRILNASPTVRCPPRGLGLVLLALPFAVPANAQAPDTSNWTCRRCPFRTGYEASYSAGASYVSDDAAHFGDATGYDEEGGYLNLGADGFYVRDDQRYRWSVDDLVNDARSLMLEGGKPGRFDFTLESRALPRRQFDTTSTVFARGGDSLTLPDNWVVAGSTAGFTELSSSLTPRSIESDRETLAAGARWLNAKGFDFFSEYRRTERDGVGIQGAAYYSNTSLLPRPFDYTTDEFELGVRRASARSTLALSYYGSLFDSSSPRIRWENPFISAPGAETGQLAQPPDSGFHQLSFSGHYRLNRYDGVVSFSASRGEAEQDEALLPYTINPNIARSLPRGSIDASVATTHVALTASLRPYRRLRLKAAYRYDDRDNDTPVLEWTRVITDTIDSSDPQSNTPYSFEKSLLSLSASYDLSGALRLAAGYDRRHVNRDFQEVARQDEETGWGEVSWRPNGSIDLRARAGTAKREPSDYDVDLAGELDQNPLMRKYELAYRFRQFAELTVTAALPDLPISLSGTLRRADDSYTESELGLLASDDTRLALDATWSVSDNSSVYLTATRDRIDSEQAGSAQFGVADWRARFADAFDSYTAGYRAARLFDRFGLGVDYTQGRGRGHITVGNAFPALDSKLEVLRVRGDYGISASLRAALELGYQSFAVRDWGLDGVGVAGVPNVLSLGAVPYDYDLYWLRFSLQYLLGGE